MAKVTHKNVTPQMVKAARALIDWTTENLAKHSSISLRTIKTFETGGKAVSYTHLTLPTKA